MPPEIKTQDNLEIDKALKEFEEKSKADQAQMPPKPTEVSDLPRMVRLVMKLSGGAIKEQREAEYVLFAFALLILGVALYFFFN